MSPLIFWNDAVVPECECERERECECEDQRSRYSPVWGGETARVTTRVSQTSSNLAAPASDYHPGLWARVRVKVRVRVRGVVRMRCVQPSAWPPHCLMRGLGLRLEGRTVQVEIGIATMTKQTETMKAKAVKASCG